MRTSEIIRENPKWFFDNFLGIDPWQKQEEITHSVFNNVRTAIRSGNSLGKTYIIARVALAFLFGFPRSVVLNTAPTHRQVENQFWRELRKAHKSAIRPLGGKVYKTRFEIDEDWFGIGFSTQDSAEGMEKFQGWHGEHMLVIVDEASGVSPFVFEAIEGAMAGGADARLVLIGNPTRNTGEFAEAFKDPDYHKIHMSAYDSPNLIAGKTVVPGLVTKEWVDRMVRKYGAESDIVRIRVKGEFPLKEKDTLISIDRVERALRNFDRERYGDEEVIGCDPARYGDDRTAFVYRKGNYARILCVLQETSTMEVAGLCKRYLKEYPEAVTRIDITGGLGAGVYDRLKEQPSVSDRTQGVNVAARAVETDNYPNLRSEGWHEAKAWLKDAILDWDNKTPEHKDEWYQLAAPKYIIMSSGKTALEPKDQMKKRGVQSPDVGDALALTLTQPTEGELQGVQWI